MNGAPVVGVYGKLPAYGDFIVRNLKASFVNPWDEWLQHYISASKEQIGDSWLDVYLTSPIWRFVLSSGVIDNGWHAGILLPSVDRVGRYFPLTMVQALPSGYSAMDILLSQSEWFQTMEDACLSALNGEIDADELVAAVVHKNVEQTGAYKPSGTFGQEGPMVFDMPGAEPEHVRCLLPYLIDAVLSSGSSSYSLWMTSGSECVNPVMFSCKRLPPLGGIASMLDGRWQQRNWKSPYKLRSVSRR